jgi:mono/diheme cytochrome c family protein
MLRHPVGLHDFHLDDGEALALALFLGDGRVSRPLSRLRDRHPDADAAGGRGVFVALNCAGCHPFEGIAGRPAAPLLTFEGSRVKADWLRRFLLDPVAIRPFGPTAGPGGRMPGFGLGEQDADSLVAWMMGGQTTLPAFEPDTLSQFDREKAATLFETRFSCTGCHAVNGRGGRIAPDLGAAAGRLEPAWIRAMLDSAGHLVPGTVMPPVAASDATLDLLAAWLATNAAQAAATGADTTASRAAIGAAAPVVVRDTGRAGYLSLIENPPPDVASGETGDYVRLCGACHGETGRGDGYNARFLRVPPADHTDAAAMASRPDDVLYDAIAAGARFLDGSPEMPGFGGVLEPAGIRSLVAHIRTLCSCEGPAWSRDGTGR